MSTQFLTQAVREALGEQVISDATMKQVDERVKSLRESNAAQGDQFELELMALREVLGVNLINPNVESQVRSRIRTLHQNPKAPQAGNPNPNPAVGGQVSPNIAPNTGSPNQPQEPATASDVKQQAGVKQNPTYADKTRDIGMPKGAKDRSHPQDVSIKENVEGDINAQQKAQFERNPEAATHGGTNNSPVGTNSGNVGVGPNVNSGTVGVSGGPGAGNTGTLNPSSNPNSAPAAGTGSTNVGQIGGNSGATGR